MQWSFSVGRVFGIPVKIHATLVLVLALLVYAFVDADEGAWAWLTPTFLVVAVFASVLAHELGHALTARTFGVLTREIILLPIGGVAMLENPPDVPRQELWIAVAGPLTSLALALVTAAAWLGSGLVLSARVGVLAELAAVNAVLGVFNLIPAFPMDGGRVLRALLALRMGPMRATRIAARIGRVIAAVLVVYGLLDGELMLALVGGFVFVAGGAEERGAAVRYVLSTRRIADLMHPIRTPLSAAATPAELSACVARDPASPAWPVAFGDRILGVVHRDNLPLALARGPREALDRNVVTTSLEAPLQSVIAHMAAARARAAVVLNADHAIVGVLSAERVAEVLREAGTARGGHAVVGQPAG